MSTERINQLHEQASERYLSGDYQGALDAWREVLSLDSTDEQALGGMRMAAQFVEPKAQQAAPGSGVEHELDEGLKILDGIGMKGTPQAVEIGAVDRKPQPVAEPVPPTEDSLEGWDIPAPPIDDDGAFGLEPVARSSPAPAPAPAPAPTPAPTLSTSAAGAELKRRVADLLAEAKAKAESGAHDEALAILARLGILDEDNTEAEALRASIESKNASSLDQVERQIIEGVAALEADRLDDAESHFREALALAPEHREAQHYLEKVAEKRAPDGHEDLLKDSGGEAAPTEDAVRRATEAASTNPAAKPKPVAPTKARASDGAGVQAKAAPPAKRGLPFTLPFALPPPKVLIAGGVGAVVLVAAIVAVPRLFHKSATAAASPAASAAAPKGPRGVKRGAQQKSAAQAPAVPASPEERAKAAAAALTKASGLMASGDFGGAVIAYNDALTLDPGNAAAKAGIAQAGERYKATKVERDAIDNIKLAFRDGEFTSGLRLAYRLPPTVPKSYIDAVKVVGWYNLAVVALRAGECREAQGHLDEALQIAPSDADAKTLRELAARYADAVKDRTFLNRVESLSFRPFPES